MNRKNIFLILSLICFINVVSATTTISIVDMTKTDESKRILVYENGVYIKHLNYSFPYGVPHELPPDEPTNITFILQEEYIDIMNDRNFISMLFSLYGNLIISSIILLIVISFLIYIYRKGSK